jgi:hypothetical protein
MSLKNYKENLKNSSSESKPEKKVKILDKDETAKSKSKVRNINIPTAYSADEKAWIEKEIAKISDQLGITVSMSSFIRSKVLADMPKED